MIEVKPFDLDMLRLNQSFFCLQSISNVEEIEVFHNTPSGPVVYREINAFSMPNGRVIVAWPDPVNTAQLYSLVAVSNGVTEIISVNSIERMIDVYDKQSDSNFGLFCFLNSNVVLQPNSDWRCDTGKYGPGVFPPSTTQIVDPSSIVLLESIISVNGIAHLIYVEYQGNPSVGDGHLNNSEKPVMGRTFWECLKLVREWSIVNSEPFNNNELIANKANQFMTALNFSNEELSLIDNQNNMQIAKYILGDENARQRPDDLFEMNDDIRNILFKRLSSGTMAALEYLNPGMWDINELIEAERITLSGHKEIFSQRLESLNMSERYINLEQRIFNNRELVLNKLEDGTF
jgi:hypothetical protein